MANKMSFYIFVMIGCIMLVSVSSHTTHIVGDAAGWNLPSDPNFYADWAKNKNFAVGDILFFQYNPGLNTVVEVNKDDYDHCTSRNTLNTYYKGNSNVTLTRPGDYFFYCSVGKHCEAGQKLWIKVCQGQGHSH